MKALPPEPKGWLSGLGARGRSLAVLQALQIATGVIGQILLLVRWSPDAQTDLFLLLSSVPWLVSAAALVGGLEMALPAAYHRALATDGESGAQRLVRQLTALSLLAAMTAALVSGTLVAEWAARSGLGLRLSLWMGVAMGGQVIPAALGGLWRGVLVARERLVRARLTMLAGSLLTVAGYALLPRPPAVSLPLTAAGAVTLAALCAWAFSRTGTNARGLNKWRPLHLETTRLIPALAALGAAAGLVHAQALIEQAAVASLGTGSVTALAVASRGWDTVLTVIVAACVMPVYPKWAESHAQAQHRRSRRLLRWSLTRALVLNLAAAGGMGLAALVLAPWFEHELGWQPGAQAAQMGLTLLPRFVLLSSVQPLVLYHYAKGTPWHPVLGAALGVGVVGLGALTLIPRWGLAGVTLTTAAGVVPGWLYLGWRERREAQACAS